MDILRETQSLIWHLCLEEHMLFSLLSSILLAGMLFLHPASYYELLDVYQLWQFGLCPLLGVRTWVEGSVCVYELPVLGLLKFSEPKYSAQLQIDWLSPKLMGFAKAFDCVCVF